jgi:choice-of-anchor B domain-containing protein
MFKHLILFLYLILSVRLLAQTSSHVDLLSHVRIPEKASSIWGHTTPAGRELALLGTVQGVRIYDISDPAAPVEKIFIQNNTCSWRELKTSGEFAYVSSECDDGLLIIDLRNPDSIRYQNIFKLPDLTGDSVDVLTSHTLYADEEGYLYLSGARPVGAGFAILDPHEDPWHPKLIYNFEDDYMHEVHVRDRILYGAELFNGAFSIWDLSDREAPVKLATQRTAFTFAHSVWIEKDRKILYTADEVTGAVVESWDVSDPLDIKRLDFYRVRNPDDDLHIPHNVFHKEDWLYISWYTEGMRVLDTRRPNNLVEVGFYDTHPDKRSGFAGCWSVYPYYPSGVVVASDIEYGMYILRFDGNRAGWMEGLVKDSITGSNLSQAQISLRKKEGGNPNTFESDQRGIYRTGVAESGWYQLTITREGYQALSLDLELFTDSLITRDFHLVPRLKSEARFEIRERESGDLLPQVHVLMYNEESRFEALSGTDNPLNCIIPDVYHSNYNILASAWGFLYNHEADVPFDGSQTYTREMEAGYEDHFMTEQGWSVQSDDSLVSWQYGNLKEFFPPPSNFPSRDSDADIGDRCLYTDNYGKIDQEFRLSGHLYLVSPPMNLKAYDQIRIAYDAWAYGGWDGSVKETILALGKDSLLVESIQENLSGKFNPRTQKDIDIQGMDRDSVRFVFHLWNDPDSAEFAIALRAALDHFTLSGLIPNQNEETSENSGIRIFPNPFSDQLRMHNADDSEAEIYIMDPLGRTVFRSILQPGESVWIKPGPLPNGVYLYRVHQSGKMHSGKLLRIN